HLRVSDPLIVLSGSARLLAPRCRTRRELWALPPLRASIVPLDDHTRGVAVLDEGTHLERAERLGGESEDASVQSPAAGRLDDESEAAFAGERQRLHNAGVGAREQALLGGLEQLHLL